MSKLEELNKQKVKLEAQIAEAKKEERSAALRRVKVLCKEFGFTARMLEDSLAPGRNMG